MTKPRVLLADDHRLFSEGLCGLLAPHFDVVGVACDGQELVEVARRLDPEVIVLDVSMPLLNGIAAARRIRTVTPRAKLVFLTAHREVAYAARALEVGASGYVLKHSTSAELISAIRVVLEGGTYLAPPIAEELGPSRRRVPATAETDEVSVELTRRQREVLQLVVSGHSAKEIAALLSISRRTAEFHKARLMETLGVQTTAGLVKNAIDAGIDSA